jgi:hypothetical protein
LSVAHGVAGAPADVTVIDERVSSLPAAALSGGDGGPVAGADRPPIRAILRDAVNVHVIGRGWRHRAPTVQLESARRP